MKFHKCYVAVALLFAITLILKWFFAAAKAQLNNKPTNITRFLQFKHEAYDRVWRMNVNGIFPRRNLFHHNNRIMFYSRR